MIELKSDICESCEIYKEAKEEFLTRFNSAYDAAVEMNFFIENCKKTCQSSTKEVVFTRDDETPSCEFCDNCQSGVGCEYCNKFTNYTNYRRTVRT